MNTAAMRRLATCLLVVALSGCGKGPPGTSQDANIPSANRDAARQEVVAAVRKDFPAACALKTTDLKQALENSRAPRMEHFPNQTLSAVFVMMVPQRAEAGTQEELDRYCKFINGQYPRSLDDFRPGPNSDEVSLVLAKDIESVACKQIDGDIASGVINLKTDLIEAHVNFIAERKAGSWQLRTLRIPAWEVETMRDERDLWRASGECVRPVFGLNPPRVDGDLPNQPGLPRVVVTLAAGVFNQQEMVGDSDLSWRGKRYQFAADAEASFSKAIQAHLAEEKLTAEKVVIVVRADQRTKMNDFLRAAEVFADLGFTQMALDVASDGFLHDSIPISLIQSTAEAGTESSDLPIKVSLFPTANGSLAQITLGNQTLGGQARDVTQALYELVKDRDEESPAVLDFRIMRGELKYENFANVAAACLGYTDIEEWHAFPVKLSLASQLMDLAGATEELETAP
jgi:hypothetical protein